MSTSYVPPAPPGAAVATIRVNDKTTLRVGPVPGRDRVWLQLTYASTFVVAVLGADQVAQLIVGLRRSGGAAGPDRCRQCTRRQCDTRECRCPCHPDNYSRSLLGGAR